MLAEGHRRFRTRPRRAVFFAWSGYSDEVVKRSSNNVDGFDRHGYKGSETALEDAY